jgi:hypothetical protein
MKHTILIIVGLMAGLSLSNAAVTVGVKNFASTSSGLAVVDNSGAGIAMSFAVGIFNPLTDFAGLSANDLLTAFTQNGSEKAGLTGNNAGIFNTSVSDAATSLDSSDSFTPNPIYVLIGNAGTIAGSTDFIVIRSATLWPQEVELVGATVAININDDVTGDPGRLLRGYLAPANLLVAGSFEGITTGVAFGVPEPTSSLLFGLAGLTLLVRRKR